MGKNLSAVLANIRQFLRDEYVSEQELDWQKDELKQHVEMCLVDISRVSPRKVTEVLTTIANSKILDISSITGLLRIKELEYPTGYDPRKKRNFDWVDDDTIEIDTTLMPSAGGSDTLTGTVTFASGSAAITGSGTLFTTELEAGYHIKKSSGTRWYRIYSIESATALTLAEPCRETTGADTVNVTQYCYETVYLYCEKIHTLTKESSTLNPVEEQILILGVSASAAIAYAQSIMGTVPLGGPTSPDKIATWGNNQLVLYRAGLERLARANTYTEYPKD